jgi:hypothetical protein
MATRYWRDQQKLQIEGQTVHCIVWPSICSFCWSRRYLGGFVLSDLRFVASVLQIEGQEIQWPQDTEEINRSYKSKVRQYKSHKMSVSCGHCIVWPSICSFCLSRRYLVAIVLSDLRFVASVYLVGILWSLEATNRRSDTTMATRYWRDQQKLQIEGQTIQKPQDTDEINRSLSCGHCSVWPSICCFCLSRQYLVAIVLSDLRFVASVYLVGILWSLYCLTFDL